MHHCLSMHYNQLNNQKVIYNAAACHTHLTVEAHQFGLLFMNFPHCQIIFLNCCKIPNFIIIPEGMFSIFSDGNTMFILTDKTFL